MRTITVDKAKLAKTLEKNRSNHRKLFEEALTNYKKHAIKTFELNIREIKSGGEVRHHLTLPVPQDHTEDYDRAIGMLEWHQGEEIELDEQQFAEFVQDDWHWQQGALATASNYVSRGRVNRLSGGKFQ